MKMKWLILLSAMLCFSQAQAQKNDTTTENKKTSEIIVTELSDYVLGDKGYDPATLFRLYPQITEAELSENDPARIMYALAKYRGKKNYSEMIKTLKDNTSVLGKEWITRIDLSLDKLTDLSTTDRNMLKEYFTKQYQKNKKNKEYARLLDQYSHYSGVVFETLEYAELLKLAAQTKKLIFMDAYTTWCAPCRMMAEKVFPEKVMGDFFNKNFICTKMDMEKGIGIELCKKFKIQAFPTFLLIDENGDVVYQNAGYRESKEFIPLFQEALKNYTK